LEGDEATTDGRCGNLGLIDGDNSRGKTDGVTSDDTTNDEHGTVLKRLLSGNNMEYWNDALTTDAHWRIEPTTQKSPARIIVFLRPILSPR